MHMRKKNMITSRTPVQLWGSINQMPAKQKHMHFCSSSLEDTVHNLASDGRTGTEDCGVSKLLTKLLAALLELARLLLCGLLVLVDGAVVAVAHVHGHVSVVADGRRGDGLFLAANVARGEDALLAGALVAALPPLVVHVLGDDDLVVGHEGKVAGILSVVLVHGGRVAEDGRADRGGWGRRVGRRGRVRGVVGVVADAVGLLLGLGRGHAEGRHLLRGHGGHGAGGICGGGELVVDGVVLRLRDDVGVDEELELLEPC